MKTKYFSSISVATILMAVIVSFSNCGEDDPAISKQDEVKAKLISGTWNVSSVTVGGTASTVYPDLKLTFTSTGFTSLNGGVVWPASGTWSFTSADAIGFTRNDDLVVTINEITTSSLKLGLTWDKTTIGPGRSSSVEGQHVFSFGK